MQCPNCRRHIVVANVGGKNIQHCPKCRCLWLPASEFDPAELRSQFVLAANFTPLVCPTCAAPHLQLGTVDNQSVYRCARCGGYFVVGSSRSSAETALTVTLFTPEFWAGLLSALFR
jgi:hypothetical protein